METLSEVKQRIIEGPAAFLGYAGGYPNRDRTKGRFVARFLEGGALQVLAQRPRIQRTFRRKVAGSWSADVKPPPLAGCLPRLVAERRPRTPIGWKSTINIAHRRRWILPQPRPADFAAMDEVEIASRALST